MVQKCFSDVFNNFLNIEKSSEILGSVKKLSENFRMQLEIFIMVRRSWKVSELIYEKSSKGPQHNWCTQVMTGK